MNTSNVLAKIQLSAMKVVGRDRPERQRGRPSRMLAEASLSDFVVELEPPVSAEEFLRLRGVSLYTLDLDRGEVVFVQLPLGHSLSNASFYFLEQYELAERVFTIGFAEMIELAQHLPDVQDDKLLMVYTTGRAGSTLVCRLLAQLDNTEVQAEPELFTLLQVAYQQELATLPELDALVDACMRFNCRSPETTLWVLKPRPYSCEIFAALHRLYPRTRSLFLYRDLYSTLASVKRFTTPPHGDAEAVRMMSRNRLRGQVGRHISRLGSLPDEEPRTLFEMLTLVWLSSMEVAQKLAQRGLLTHAIFFESWKSAPVKTAYEMLVRFGLSAVTDTRLLAVLGQDSQKGTPLAQSVNLGVDFELTEQEQGEVLQVLRRFAPGLSPTPTLEDIWAG